jgi:hypothetical protein
VLRVEDMRLLDEGDSLCEKERERGRESESERRWGGDSKTERVEMGR